MAGIQSCGRSSHWKLQLFRGFPSWSWLPEGNISNIYIYIVIYDVIYEKHWESKNVFVKFSNILMMPRTGSKTEGQLSRPTGDAVRADKLHPHLLPSPSWTSGKGCVWHVAKKPPLPRLKVGNLLKLPQMLCILYRDGDLQILSAGPPLYCISHLLLVSYIPLHSHRIPVTSKGPTAGCNSCRVARLFSDW